MEKNKEIRIIKNPKDLEPTFVGDRPADLVENYLNLQQNYSSSNNSNDTEKLVMKARHDSNKFYNYIYTPLCIHKVGGKVFTD